MKTIKWIIDLIPENVRALVAVLLIAISVLSGTLVYIYKDLQSKLDDRKTIMESMMRDCEHKTDSLTAIIISIKDANKKEVLDRLEVIISEQKDQIKSQMNVLTNQPKVIHKK